MEERFISFAASSSLNGSAQHWLRTAMDHWPSQGGGGPARPIVREQAMEPFLDTLAATTNRRDMPHAAFLAFALPEPAAMIDRAVECLRQCRIPAVVLVSDPAPWRAFQREGILFERFDAPPDLLAAYLFALVERQGVVELLEREAAVTRRCENSIREEMDRLHEELHLAASIQREFTGAPTPNIPGVSVATLLRPVNFVNGDLLCLRDLGDGRLAYFMADAAGHGMPAALLTMVLSHALTTHDQAGRALKPTEVLALLNLRLCNHCRGSAWFATAQYGIISAAGDVVVASAGHPPATILSSTSVRELSEAGGPVLGLSPDAEYTQEEDTLGPDEMLVAHTDGLEEALPYVIPERRGLGLHAPYLHALFTACDNEQSPELLLARVTRLLDEQSGSLHQRDDVSMLAITAPGAAAPMRLAA
ncbi:MAG: serine/threonine-protein phosphatase [Planctomycetes bacterium]|nr:serine/threonine-protein phosphatase [Planctomycetota bacterium]